MNKKKRPLQLQRILTNKTVNKFYFNVNPLRTICIKRLHINNKCCCLTIDFP